MERDKSLRIMNIVGAVLFGLTALLYLLIIIFPEGALNAFQIQPEYIEIDAMVIMLVLMKTIKPIIFAVLGVIGFIRKNMSFGWGIGTAVGIGILWLFPAAIVQRFFVYIVELKQLAYADMLDSAIFGYISSIGVLLIFGSAVAEAYAVKKLQ